jgi:hypothetical protein
MYRSDAFELQNGTEQGDALSPLLLVFVFQYAIAHETQKGLEWNGTDLLPVFVVFDVQLLARNLNTDMKYNVPPGKWRDSTSTESLPLLYTSFNFIILQSPYHSAYS